VAEKDLLVRILGDDRDFQKTVDRTERRLKQFDARTNRLGQAARGGLSGAGAGGTTSLLFGSAAFVGTAAVAAGLTKTIKAATDLNETVSKSRQVFGAASSEVEAFGESSAQSFGISKQASIEAAATFGNLFRTVKLLPAENARLSTSLVKLAADLASFNNVDPSEVLIALRSGLIGEAEPLRRFGVLLSETRVQQEALNETGKTNVKTLTDQEKVLARYAIILRDTKTAQGDFARTSDGLANQQRILKANLADLAATAGRDFLPATIAVVGGLNDLLETGTLVSKTQDAIRQSIHDSGISMKDALPALEAYRDGLASIKGEGDALVVTLDQIIGKQIEARFRKSDISRGEGRTAESVVASNAEVEARKQQAETDRARKALERSRKDFSSFTKGLGLKLDKAGLTATFDDDLAVLREIERGIERQISREGRTFKLVQQLTDVRKQIADTVAKRAEASSQAAADAFNSIIDALSLNLEIAQSTTSLKDDQAALRALEQAILARIQTEGQTTDLMRQLFQVRQQEKEVAQRLADQQRERKRSKQFEALGLTAEGEDRAPSTRSLKRRGESLEERIKGTTLDTKHNRQVLENAAKVLSGQFGKVGRDVRLAIERMFDEIASALEGGDKKVGPLTKTTSLNTKKILAGLGLSPEEERALRSRLSNFNSAGVGLAGANQTGTTGRFVGGASNVVVENNVTVEIDGKKISSTVTKEQQKTRRRNPQQKRGQHRR